MLQSAVGIHFTRRAEPVLSPEADYEIDGSVEDPRLQKLGDTFYPIFAPKTAWEKIGQVPNVVFVEGLVQRDNRYFFYYGAADKYVGVAEAPAK